jgi:molybdopterin-biosynthesis enzyme MoeA-like protein
VRAEIILVGDELLEDMHGAQPVYIVELMRELGSDLAAMGYSMGRLSVVGDGDGEVAALLDDASSRHVDLVVTVGGLGPTHDDRVRDEVARALGKGPPVTHPVAHRWLVECFDRKGIDLPEEGGAWERMGQVPGGVEPVRNPVGMAAGLAFRMGDATEVRCLPGVTFEALPMWREEVLPDMDSREGPPPDRTRRVLMVRGSSEGVVGPIVERFVRGFPGIRARVNLMDADGHRFRSIKVTLTGDPREMGAAVDHLMEAFDSVEGVEVEATGWEQ